MAAPVYSSRSDSFSHVVQLYGSDEQALTVGVARYLADGLALGDGILVIATGPHIDAFISKLTDDGLSPAAAMGEGRMVCLDAATTLADFMIDGRPDWQRFSETIDRVVRMVRGRVGPGGLRAYGEMVSLLWETGDVDSAIRLEEFWNRFLAAYGFDLYCAYAIDPAAANADPAAIEAILHCHTHQAPN